MTIPNETIENHMEAIYELQRDMKDATWYERQRIEEFTKRHEEKSKPFNDKIAEHEAKIRDIVFVEQSSFKNDYGKVTYTKGHVRVSWDTDKLLGYAVAYPAVLEFKKESKVDPRVNIKVE
jgi:hypothetical protein